jgi:hypothetical protein
VSLANDLYLRVRGNILDEPTHIHFDTGNNQYYNQYIGDDNKYVQLANTGNIVINTNNYAGNTAQWTFSTDGLLTLPAGSSRITSYGQITIETDNNSSGMYLNADGVNLLYANANVTLRANSTGTNKDWNFGSDGDLTFPTGNLVITPVDAAFGNSAVIASEDHNLITLSTGANGGVSSLWVEDIGNVGTSNIAAVYANPTPGSKIVRIAVGQNGGGGGGPNLWDFDASGNLTVPGNINFGGDPSAAPSLNDFASVTSAANFAIVADSANTDQTWNFDSTGNLTLPGNTFSVNYANNTPVDVVTRFEGSWTVPVGNSTQSFTVSPNETYSMWVDCNIPNGILTWNATATVTNTNVPVVGAQYAWVYNGGGTPIDFTSIPNQFIGTANTIVRSNVAPSSTTNRFDFGINNTSGGNVTVRYGWIQIS